MKQGGKYLNRKPKKQRLRGFVRGVLTFLAAAVCLTATLPMMKGMVLHVGSPLKQEYKKGQDLQIREELEGILTNDIAALLGSVQPLPGGEEETVEPVKPVKKFFWLKDEDLVAPEPDQSKFGETDDPATLQWLIDEAAELLEGQELYFDPASTQIIQGTKVTYYLDDTILAITWKEMHDFSVYTFSEVKIAHASQFRRFLADGEYGSEKQYLTTEMAQSVNAVVASSGDFYRFREFGAVVYEGQVRRVRGDLTDTCLIDKNGDLHFFRKGEVLDVETAQTFVDEHEVRFSLCFGPVLIENGERCVPGHYLLGEIDEEYARAGLCQMGKLHYILAAANTEGAYQQVPTLFQFAASLEKTGCDKAFALDGGQTAAIVMNDQLINRPVKGSQRKISDIIYFATAIPSFGDKG